MDLIKGLNSKTVLEHLIFLSNKNIVGTCKELQITPQQFTDWIKHRRPVPAERLEQLAKYFLVTEEILVDEKKFAKKLSTLNGIELEIMVLSRKQKYCASKADKEELEYRLSELEREKEKQIRIIRLAAILENSDENKLKEIDALLEKLENPNE